MRIFSFIPPLAVFVTAVTGAALPVEPIQDDCGYKVGCELAQLAVKRDLFEYPTRTIRGLTDAALLRRGLSLNNPIMRRSAFDLWYIADRAVHSEGFPIILGIPARRTVILLCKAPEPRPEPESKPEPKKIRHHGIIRIKEQSDSSIGYASRSPSTQA